MKDNPITLEGLGRLLPFGLLIGTTVLGFAGTLVNQAVMQAKLDALVESNQKAELATTQRLDAFEKGLADESVKSYGLDSRLTRVETTLQVKGLISKLPEASSTNIIASAARPDPQISKGETTPSGASATLNYTEINPSPGPTPNQQQPTQPPQQPEEEPVVRGILTPILNLLP